jgi:hypothetical protein
MGELPKGRGFRINFYNRLAVIAMENISPANLGLVILTIKIVLAKNRDPNLLGL